MSKIQGRIIAPLLIVMLSLPTVADQTDQAKMATATRELEVVPCLLASRVRKLGNLVYPERRRLVEVSARDCRLKGGEFTFYDRAKPENAVSFFSKLATDGDLEAQVSLGDVYQYLFIQPNYELAAKWYVAAADAGSKKGMMQLARLYERGLGVEADPLKATNLWREATGAGEELVLASTLEASQTEAASRIGQLTDQLRRRNEEAESVRYALSVARADVESRKAAMIAAEAEIVDIRNQISSGSKDAQNSEELLALKGQLESQQSTLADQRFQIGTLEDDLVVREAQLTADLRQVERQNERLTAELSRVSTTADQTLQFAVQESEDKDNQLASLQQELSTARGAVQDTDSAYSDLSAQLDQVRAAASDSRRSQKRVKALESEQATQLAQLNEQRQEMGQLETKLAEVSTEAEALQRRLDDQIDSGSEAQARYALAEAELQRVRTNMNDMQRQLADANAELAQTNQERLALKNQLAAGSQGSDEEVQRMGIMLAQQDRDVKAQQAEITKLTTLVENYAGELTEIRLRRSSLAMRTPMLDTSSIRLPRDLKIGNYHALVIGNNDYEYLTDLANAQNDARAVHELLQTEYSFKSTLLLDATKVEIFRAFQKISGEMKEDDLVVIYYAGHGFRTKTESFWLPVEVPSREAADISNIHGVSSQKVADWVRAMPAKHVMIIADSCYSGSGIATSGGYRYDIETLEASLPYFMQSRSRTMLTSGDLSPVMDGDGGDGLHSIFTEAFLGLLNENKGVLDAGSLHDYLVERVKYSADGLRVNQTPKFGSIESAGHENGQFVFLHRTVQI